MTPFEALYGRKCQTPIYWEEVEERRLLRPELVYVTIEKIRVIHERLLAAKADKRVMLIKGGGNLNFRLESMNF